MPAKNSGKKSTTFPAAIRSFVGYLEGTQKAAHTVKNYSLDLLAFQKFVYSSLSDQPIALELLTSDHVERYHAYLKGQGLKSNTRRRKLLTIRRFLKFLNQRKKLPMDVGHRVPTPHKIERIPFTVSSADLRAAIRSLPDDTVLSARNRVLLWTLAETGCLVSEVTQLRFQDCRIGANGTPELYIGGKAPRSITVSRELFESVQALTKQGRGTQWLFLGYNKFGPLGGPISARGVELLVRSYAERLGFPKLTPRTFRHSVVLGWFGSGVARSEIQRRLGLRSAYAFRSFAPLLASIKSIRETTSTS